MNSILTSFNSKHSTDKNKEEFFQTERLTLLRKLDKTSRVKPSINFYSHKLHALQYAESILETDAYLHLEFEPTVKRYLTQPCSFKLNINNRKTRYTPDALVEDIYGNYFFLEVKPSSKLQEDKNSEKFSQIKSYFEEELNVPFRILTEKDIRVGKLTQNLQQLYVFLDVALDNATTKKIVNTLPEKVTVKTLEQVCHQFHQLPHYAWALIAHGYFNFHFEEMLTRSTLISVNKNYSGA
jgi:DNA-binding Xre family transcriptional regulator